MTLPAIGDDTPSKSPSLANLSPPWQPGKSGNPTGRPKGARAKLSEDFCQALLDDFIEGGIDAIRMMRADKPNEYAKMIASIMAKESDVALTGPGFEALLYNILDSNRDRSKD